MPELLPPPTPISLLICDGIHTDPYTGRKTLLGLYDEFVAADYPTVIPVCWFYAEVTGCRGDTLLRVSVVLADPEADPVWESEPAEFRSDSPLNRAFLDWSVTELPLPEPGVYLVQLVDSHDRVIHERRLAARIPPDDNAEAENAE